MVLLNWPRLDHLWIGQNRGNSCHRSDGSSMTNVRARTLAEVLARGRAASPGRRSSNANSLCGQNSAGSGQSERPFKGIFCDDVSEFESDHLSQPVRLQRVTYEGCLKSARHREVSQIRAGLRVRNLAMETPFPPPVSAGLFWCLVFEKRGPCE
jgi:hypothetical protein